MIASRAPLLGLLALTGAACGSQGAPMVLDEQVPTPAPSPSASVTLPPTGHRSLITFTMRQPKVGDLVRRWDTVTTKETSGAGANARTEETTTSFERTEETLEVSGWHASRMKIVYADIESTMNSVTMPTYLQAGTDYFVRIAEDGALTVTDSEGHADLRMGAPRLSITDPCSYAAELDARVLSAHPHWLGEPLVELEDDWKTRKYQHGELDRVLSVKAVLSRIDRSPTVPIAWIEFDHTIASTLMGETTTNVCKGTSTSPVDDFEVGDATVDCRSKTRGGSGGERTQHFRVREVRLSPP